MVKTVDQKKADEKFYAHWDNKLEPLEVSSRSRTICSVLLALIVVEVVAVWIFNIGDLIKSYPYANIIAFGVFAINVLLCGYTVGMLMHEWSEGEGEI